MQDHTSLKALASAAAERGISIGQLILEEQAELLEIEQDQLLATMDLDLTLMEQAASAASMTAKRSTSGITGGDANRMHRYLMSKEPLLGGFAGEAVMVALAVAENNAAMGKIVACPTAGSCGILPAVLIPALREGIARHDCCLAMLTAGGVGMVIASQASISGAEGGCQAECGSAAAMAAAALVELKGGTPDMAIHAAAIAIKNLLGLVCDPVAGLVEVPCIKRNAGGASVAVCAADMALAGITSVIPPDEVVTAMREVGEAIAPTLRETAEGGLATTPTGRAIAEKLLGDPEK